MLKKIRDTSDKKSVEGLSRLSGIIQLGTGPQLEWVLVMPFYERGNLEAYLSSNLGVYEWQFLRNWYQQLWGMGVHLRLLGVVHRNIRPSNICLTMNPRNKYPTLMLVDWKCAVETEEKMDDTRTVLECFDMSYQPPEVVFG